MPVPMHPETKVGSDACIPTATHTPLPSSVCLFVCPSPPTLLHLCMTICARLVVADPRARFAGTGDSHAVGKFVFCIQYLSLSERTRTATLSWSFWSLLFLFSIICPVHVSASTVVFVSSSDARDSPQTSRLNCTTRYNCSQWQSSNPVPHPHYIAFCETLCSIRVKLIWFLS